jgi:hypothetical protein
LDSCRAAVPAAAAGYFRRLPVVGAHRPYSLRGQAGSLVIDRRRDEAAPSDERLLKHAGLATLSDLALIGLRAFLRFFVK